MTTTMCSYNELSFIFQETKFWRRSHGYFFKEKELAKR